MSKAASSPTARLLQSSRLFSLPRPLPIQPELTTGVFRNSETATTPHPTHQAITTPASSLHRGDWGLKRPIPSKKTKTSTPAIRVKANDTYEHITSFSSAGDHVQTERKWAQMEVPITQKRPRLSRSQGDEAMSVFEEWFDNTDPDAQARYNVGARARTLTEKNFKAMQRWKYKGPWLGGMQDGEFEQYLVSKIDRPGVKKQWREFLKVKEVETRVEEVRREAMRSAVENEEDVSEEEIAEEIDALRRHLTQTSSWLLDVEKSLRDDHLQSGLSSRLTALIAEFLDLPNLYHPPSTSVSLSPTLAHQMATGDFDSGPPTTHPSAGLSHLRTNAIMHNHPLYGPQKTNTPVQSRVVRPRTKAGAVLEQFAKLGVGGVVADDAVTATSAGPASARPQREEERMAHSLDEDAVGGNKIWVHPETAYIDHKSRIHLSLARAEKEAVAIKTEDQRSLDEIKEMKSGVKRSAGAESVMLPEGMEGRGRGRTLGAGRGWGVGRESGVRGFDAELGAR